MPSLAVIILVAAVALGVWWKVRCIWRGCSVDPARDDGP